MIEGTMKHNAKINKIILDPFFLFKLYFGTKFTSKFNILQLYQISCPLQWFFCSEWHLRLTNSLALALKHAATTLFLWCSDNPINYPH
jgi:hypothetical protein